MIFQKGYTLHIDPRPSIFSVSLVAALLAVLGGGERASAQCAVADIDNNRVVDGADLETLLSVWGPCPGGTPGCLADLDNNADVNGVDLGRLLASWGPCGPNVPAWNESIDGPLSGTMSAPTPVTFLAGDNRIIGSSTPAPGAMCTTFKGGPPDPVIPYFPGHESYTDVFTFTLTANQRLVAIEVEALDVIPVHTSDAFPCIGPLESQLGAFTAINNSNQIDWNSDNVINFITLPTLHPLIGMNFAKFVGDDLLAKFREEFPIPGYGGVNSPDLVVANGTYTFWWKDGANHADYTLNFIVEESGVAWNELLDGPLSGTMSAPTPVTFLNGDNRIIGSSTPAPGAMCATFKGGPPDPVIPYFPGHESYTDVFTFTLAANQRLVAIEVEALDVIPVHTSDAFPCIGPLASQLGAFTAINNSNQIDWNSDNVINFITLPTLHPLIGMNFAKSVGDDLLAKFREEFPIPGYGGVNSPYLVVANGTYTFWWKDGANHADYTLNFIVEETK